MTAAAEFVVVVVAGYVNSRAGFVAPSVFVPKLDFSSRPNLIRATRAQRLAPTGPAPDSAEWAPSGRVRAATFVVFILTRTDLQLRDIRSIVLWLLVGESGLHKGEEAIARRVLKQYRAATDAAMIQASQPAGRLLIRLSSPDQGPR